MSLPLGRWPEAIVTIARTFGAEGARRRARHELRRATGWFRASPQVLHLEEAGHPLFTIDAAALDAADRAGAGRARAIRTAAGEYHAFRSEWTPFPDGLDSWRRHPATGQLFPDHVWWNVPHFSPVLGDIKTVWEPARFAWGYDLGRGWLLSGDERYPETFFRRFEEWSASARPFRGPHWACGQETAIRAIALLYAEAAFATAQSATATRRQHLATVLGWSGERIADAIDYALSQRNNHGISEAVGLVVLGVRLRDLHPEAAGWRRRGERLLADLISRQFAPDGWYIQHSFTYLRLALDQCVVAQRVLATQGASLSAESIARIRAASGLLGAVIDEQSGIVPNHGANDGAFVHPITSAEYRDFRPVVTAVAATFATELPSGIQPDAEVLAWLSMHAPRTGSPPGDGIVTGESGWAAARLGPWRLFFRAGAFHSRPGHLDSLQLDVRYDGREIVTDPGTFSYNAAPPWRNGLIGATVHNGPLVNDQEPGVRGPRFLWYIWPHARLTGHAFIDGKISISGERPREVHRRVEANLQGVTITDTALASGSQSLAISWLLAPGVDPVVVTSTAPTTVTEAAEGSVAGWFSPRYQVRIASRTVHIRALVDVGGVVTTCLAPATLASDVAGRLIPGRE